MEKVNQKCLKISIIKILLYFRRSSITIIPSARSNVILIVSIPIFNTKTIFFLP